LQLYGGLLATAWRPAIGLASARSTLLAAALLHDVGKFKGDKNHHKKSFKLLHAHGNPLGWGPSDFRRAAIVARFHRGALPTKRHKLLRDLLPDEQKGTIQLAAILRLANAMDAAHNGRIRRIHIENPQIDTAKTRVKRTGGFLRKLSDPDRNQPLILVAEGYTQLGSAARCIAAERHLLETLLRRPVVVRPMTQPARLDSPRRH
jgi:exopolyphosphatase/pppGpp-phosphohydrolase